MNWEMSHHHHTAVLPLADVHYSRQKPGTNQFVAPGSCVVLMAVDWEALEPYALWVTLFSKFAKHAWADAWVNSFFRLEGGSALASDLIRQAVAATRAVWGPPPAGGMVSFIDASKIRKKRDPGRCYRKAGFTHVGETPKGLLVMQMKASEMPPPEDPKGFQKSLFDYVGT